MRWGTVIFYIILSGILIPAYEANAVIIKSTDTLQNNYSLHHRVIIYNDLASYKNTNNKHVKNDQVKLSQQFSSYDRFDNIKDTPENIPDLKNTKLTKFHISNSNMKKPYDFISSERANLDLKNSLNSNFDDLPIGTFLESFKEDPLLQTIYFTSKDMIFSYKKKIANVLQLGFDMDENDYKNFEGSWQQEQEALERLLYSKDNQNLKREARFLFGFILDSYKTIIYVILSILAVVYISFRYFLNKYI